ncbi:hypothetical protein [Bradyrhizobium sp. USDA 3256]
MSTRCARSAIAGAAAIGDRAHTATTDRAITDGIIVRNSTIARIITGTALITADIMVAITAADITADTIANHQRGGFGPLTLPRLKHDPEKCEAVFRKDHAQTKS